MWTCPCPTRSRCLHPPTPPPQVSEAPSAERWGGLWHGPCRPALAQPQFPQEPFLWLSSWPGSAVRRPGGAETQLVPSPAPPAILSGLPEREAHCCRESLGAATFLQEGFQGLRDTGYLRPTERRRLERRGEGGPVLGAGMWPQMKAWRRSLHLYGRGRAQRLIKPGN